MNAGQPVRAESLLEQARPELDEPLLRAEALRLDGRLRVQLRQAATGPALLLEAAQAFEPLDPPRVREVLLETFDVCFVSQRLTAGTTLEAVAEVALGTERADPATATFHDLLLEGTSNLFLERYDVAMPLLREIAATLVSGTAASEDVALLFNFGFVATNELWDEETYATWSRIVEEQARRRGALYALRVALLALSKYEIRRGRFAAARVHYEETAELSRAVGISAEYNRSQAVDLLAWEGDPSAIDAGQEMMGFGTTLGSGAPVAFARMALGTLALSDGRYVDALAAVRPLVDENHPGWSSQALITAVEAAARIGDTANATRALDQLDLRATAAGTPWGLSQLARARALTTDGEGAEAHFHEAIALVERTSIRTELAQTHLLYGEWLRRQQRSLDARVELTIAHDMFSEMGAQGFARRAAGELAATGERVRERTVATANGLTPQETQIARLAATGATNAEIGERLFISANTVDYHLRKVFQEARHLLPPPAP